MSALAAVRARVPRWLVPLMMAAAGLMTLLAWALASPTFSGPDDDYHLASLWCAHGTDATCQMGDDPRFRVLPTRIVAAGCFVGNSTISAACQADLPSGPAGLVPTDRGNWNPSYPPAFYWVNGLLVGDDVESSVLRVRALGSVLAVGAVGVLCWLLPARYRRVPLVPLAVAMVPLGLFTVPSTNPSSWTLISAVITWPALYAALEAEGRRRWGLLATYALGVALAAGSRADGALFSILVTGVVLLLQRRRLRGRWPEIVACAVALVVCLWSALGSAQSQAAATGLSGYDDLSPLPGPVLMLSNARDLGLIVLGSFGFGPLGALGWWDVYVPTSVQALSIGAVIGVVFVGIGDLGRRKAVGIALLAFAVTAYPLVILQLTRIQAGGGFQPRYDLPLILALVAMVMLPGRGAAVLTRVQQIALVAAVGTAQAIALGTCMRRYITGTDVNRPDLDSGREWWWQVPLPPTLVWAIGTLAFVAFAALATAQLVQQSHGPTARHRMAQPLRPAPRPGRENGVALAAQPSSRVSSLVSLLRRLGFPTA